MISFVIPTLWKSELTTSLIAQFERCKYPFELIIIDNADTGYENHNPNIRVLSFAKNLGVNASWNLGVKEARYNYVCLLNDDIMFNVHNYIHNVKLLIQKYGDFHLVAPYDTKGSAGYFSTRISRDDEDFLKYIKGMTHKEFGMGCFMTFPKEVWIEIPDTLQTYYGDDVLWYSVHNIIRSEKLWWFGGFPIIGEFSRTSKNNKSILDKENDHFQDFVKSGLIKEKSIWQR